MPVICSSNLDPAYNLALEEALLGEVDRFAPTLFLWRSSPGVVVGKNQNPWRECRTDRLAADGTSLARRVSGGGTVYHDEGNLNFSLLLRRTAYDEAAQFEMVRRALRGLGVDARLMNRNSLAVDGRKVSGNAFCFRRDAALHHGTLLVSADLDRLHRYLGDLPNGFETHAIASVAAKVVNLADLHPGLGWEQVAEALERAFRSAYADASETLDAADLDPPGLARLRERHISDAWRLERTPRFAFRMGVPGGAGELVLTVEHGRVTDARVEGADGPDALMAALAGARFDAGELAARLGEVPAPDLVPAQVLSGLKAQSFRWVGTR